MPADHLVVFSLEPLPAPWALEVQRGGGLVIAGPDFRRLVDELGIESSLVAKDPTIHRPAGSALPSARELDADMARAQTWLAAGVLPLAARFYEQAVKLKPEFLAGWVGLARARTGLGAWEEAASAWERVLAIEPRRSWPSWNRHRFPELVETRPRRLHRTASYCVNTRD